METFHRDILVSIFKWFDPATQSLCRFVCTRWWRLSPAPKYIRYTNYVIPSLGVIYESSASFTKVFAGSYTSDFRLFQWAIQKGCPSGRHAAVYAAEHGNREILEWIHQQYKLPEIYIELALHGHLEIMKWMYELKEYKIPGNCANASLKSTRAYEILEWLEQIEIPPSATAITAAIACGHPIQMLDWLHQHKYSISSYATYEAAGNDRLDALKWLRQRGTGWVSRVYYAALSNGNIEILEYLFTEGSPTFDDMYLPAVHKGNFDAIKWSYSKGYPLNSELYQYVYHVSILDWLYQYNCPKPANIDNAVGNTKLPVLKWFYQHNFVFTNKALAHAIASGYLDIATWLITPINGKSICSLYPGVYVDALWNRNMDVLEFLYDQGYPLTNDTALQLDGSGNTPFQLAIKLDYLSAMKWFISHNYPINQEPINLVEYATNYDSAFKRSSDRTILEYLKMLSDN